MTAAGRVTRVAAILRRAVPKLAEPAVGRIKRETRDPYRILVSCVVSLRTKDEVTDVASRRLFALARTPRVMARLPAARIARTIYPAGFYRTKARQIRALSRILLARHRGRVPADRAALMALPGVGIKTTNLVLGEGFGIPAICVDIHVHRISNRLGLIRTRTPEESEVALRRLLPRRLWIEWNRWLVPFGRAVCQPVSPWCSKCPLARCCPRRGVTRKR
ncbi:MAG: endonuclease III [bacterium]